VRLLTAGEIARTEQSGNVLSVAVPRVEVHEVVAIDL
jgi:hypothetical protein